MLISNELGIDCASASLATHEVIMSQAMKKFSFRIPPELHNRLLEAVKLTGRTRSFIVREAWERQIAEWPELEDGEVFRSVEGTDAPSARK
jgi:predicted DNA-binding protein